MAVEMQQGFRNRRAIVVIAALLLAVAGGFGAWYMSRSAGPSVSGTTKSVVVLTADLPAQTKISDADVTLDKRAVEQVAVDAFTTTSQAVGQYTSTALKKNTVLFPALVVGDTSQAGQLSTTAPLDIHDNYVAMTLPLDAARMGVGGYIRPDDHIDIIVDVGGNDSLKYAFQDVRVLKVGHYVPPADSSSGSAPAAAAEDLLVVEVPRAQGEELAYALATKDPAGLNSSNLVVQYVLRPVSQYGKDKNGKPLGSTNYLDSGDATPPTSNDTPINGAMWSALFS